jgi:tetratricopeptide (TPR) repeat protein
MARLMQYLANAVHPYIVVTIFVAASIVHGQAKVPVADSIVAAPATAGQTPEARFAAARKAAVAMAPQLYQELLADTTLPDSLRSLAGAGRADLAFALREYETAVDYYKRAAAFEKRPGLYHYRYALAACADGDTGQAVKIATLTAEAGEAGPARGALVLLGECAIGRGAYKEAMALFQKTGPCSPADAWSVPSLLGKLACARTLGLADSAATYEKQLQTFAPALLEKERLRKIREIPFPKAAVPTAAKKCDTVVVPVKDTAVRAAGKDSIFALQVGAFGSKERARAFTKKLAAKYKDVECVSATVDERTIYRVWVGNFESREEAEGFGKTNFMRKGMVYRVVMK